MAVKMFVCLWKGIWRFFWYFFWHCQLMRHTFCKEIYYINLPIIVQKFSFENCNRKLTFDICPYTIPYSLVSLIPNLGVYIICCIAFCIIHWVLWSLCRCLSFHVPEKLPGMHLHHYCIYVWHVRILPMGSCYADKNAKIWLKIQFKNC